jgi:transcriptional regulator with XRE-family HTH domain
MKAGRKRKKQSETNDRLHNLLVERIIERLTALDLTGIAASELAGRNPCAISDILRGNTMSPTVGLVEDLAAALECDPAYLVGWNERAGE